MAYEHILVETRGSVGLITLNRPKAMNALCADLAREIAEAVDAYEADDAIGALVLTGSETAFCAGARCHAPRFSTQASWAAGSARGSRCWRR